MNESQFTEWKLQASQYKSDQWFDFQSECSDWRNANVPSTKNILKKYGAKSDQWFDFQSEGSDWTNANIFQQMQITAHF